MGASQFVGRVGGLAVALGVGAGLFAGAGAAWADSSAPDTRSVTGSATDSVSDSSKATSANRGRAATAVRAPAAAEPEPEPVAVELEPEVTPEPIIHIDPVFEEPPVGSVDPVDPVEEIAVDTEPAAAETTEDPADPPVDVPDPLPFAVDPGPVDQDVQTTVTATSTSAPTAKADNAPLTVAPVNTYYDGVLQGNLNVVSASGCGAPGSDCTLDFSFVEASKGGKVLFNNVPTALNPLLPGGAKGGAGSYTFLPYATWIDPANPTSFPTPTGEQSFTVRVSENTKFNQTITSIPLIGLLAEPIIQLLQQLPLISGLLVPLIGASVTTTVSVNVGQLAAGKQVAYTYFVDSFDGTPISMNYFPASTNSLLPTLGNKQATIFNGPGIAAPGETNPYGSFQASGSAPGLGLIRGQGLPGPFAAAPLGFNVVTWDPRGEFASGGILQLDNPFYEGRDVSALIDWAQANTPLLNEGGKPDVAMIGGSYGGGIQMSTVDPRIKAIVPAIAWNSFNESLYPNEVFKTAYVNSLALGLLGTGASSIDRINSQITQGIITGNLFGFLSETAQAVLASSGPTTLLTKLNAPTMYVQGTADPLFPLQQALENARTQLEQNPFFAGPNADLVKMIWYCGGHGFCTSQTPQQLAAQAQVLFVENLLWVNKYTKGYLAGIPAVIDPINGLLSAIAPFQWWDQKGTALASFAGMPWTAAFQNTAPILATKATGGNINSFTSKSGPLTEEDPAGASCATVSRLCEFPANQVFATKAKNAVNLDIPIAATDPKNIVGAPKVSFTYSGLGNAKAIYAQIVDNASGQVLGNTNTPIPVTLDGKEHTIENFEIANIAYTAPSTPGAALTLQFVANSSLFQNTAVIWNVNISDISVSLPTTGTAIPNPVPGLLPA
jgi:ABC-2 type transport system ATP-binding protein